LKIFKKMTNKRKLITNKANVRLIKKLMTKEAFHAKFEVSMKVVCEILAEDAIVKLYFNDSRAATADEISELKKGRKNGSTL